MYMRQQYMTSEVSHEQYYGQFVTEELKSIIELRFGKEALQQAYQEDKDFNTIPLKQWDILTAYVDNIWDKRYRKQLKACGDVYSLSSGVCLLKECARQIVSE